MSTFVTVGNSLDPFSRLLDQVARLAAAHQLPEPVIVQHGNTPFECAACSAHRFIDRETFQEYIRQAELVITHGGMTVMHALNAGKVPVVMPRRGRYNECSDDHQLEFSHPRAAAGEIVLVEEPGRLLECVERALVMQTASAGKSKARTEPPLVSEIRQVLEDLQTTARAKQTAR